MSAIEINSEIGRIRKVLLHQPGVEIERVTPANAAEVLYDDILYLPRALSEHNQLEYVLSLFAEAVEVHTLMQDVLSAPEARAALLLELCTAMNVPELIDDLTQLTSRELVFKLIGGALQKQDTLSRYLNPDHYALPPLPNFFFMRDAAMCINDRVITGSMANRIRAAEAIIMKHVFLQHPDFAGCEFYFDTALQDNFELTIEGGDVLIPRKDVVVIGHSERTSIKGIDALIHRFAAGGQIDHVIVVEIPKRRASIHLDMIFTMVDVDTCVVFPPLITGPTACRTIHVRIDGGKVASIQDRENLLEALKFVGIDLQPIPCGGSDVLHQEREQWTSGANFFALAPGKIVGYGRNVRTFDEVAKHGFEIVRFSELREGRVDVHALAKCAISIEGAELSRGGGGCRCMTLPVKRDPIAW